MKKNAKSRNQKQEGDNNNNDNNNNNKSANFRKSIMGWACKLLFYFIKILVYDSGM